LTLQVQAMQTSLDYASSTTTAIPAPPSDSSIHFHYVPVFIYHPGQSAILDCRRCRHLCY
jgi:hypothetical protein